MSPIGGRQAAAEQSKPQAGDALCRVFVEHAGYVSDKWEQYLPIYQSVLAGLIANGRPVRLLEIGVQNGGSLQIWSKFLPAGSTIVGIDIDPACASFAVEPNISIRIGDASNPAALGQMLGEARFDVVIDDGSHRSDQITSTFRSCFERLNPGGFYVVEDLHCSYWSSHGGGFRLADSAIEQFKNLADALNADHFERDAISKLDSRELERLRQVGKKIASISFFDSLVVIEKLKYEKNEPYRRVVTGRTAPVVDLVGRIAVDPYQIRKLLLSHEAASAFAPTLPDELASARGELERLRAEVETLRTEVAQITRERDFLADDGEQLRAEAARQSQEADALRTEMSRITGVRDFLAADGEKLHAEAARQSRETEALQTEVARVTDERDFLVAEREKKIARILTELADRHEELASAERTIAYVSEKYANARKKNVFRTFRDALRLALEGKPVPTSRYNLISNSVFFDKNYYLASNPDVKAEKFDPVVHYLRFGGQEGRDPGPQFSEAGYRALSPDVAATSLSALEHYESHGRDEGRRLLARGLRSASRDVKAPPTSTPPGAASVRESLERSGLFDAAAYLEMNEEIQLSGADPWAHFLGDGIREGQSFTGPVLVARALSRLAPQIQEASQEVTERLSGHAGEEEIVKAAAPLVATGARVAVYCSSVGNFFFQEIANLVHWQLKALGINSSLRTDESEVDEEFDIRVFVAPHEFFLLGRGAAWATHAGMPGSVLYNTEQVQTPWFRTALPYLVKAPLVCDLNLQTTCLSRQLGCKSIYYTPPYLPACPYTIPQLDVSNIEHLRGYDFARKPFDWTQHPGLAERPIDILFVGTGCERRLKVIERLRELVDRYRFVCIYTHQTSPLSDTNCHTRNVGVRSPGALAQRSKIVLNVHRDWIGYFEWPRMVMHGLWQGACVVSDPCFPDPVFLSGAHFLEEATRHLPELLHWLLGTPDGQSKMNEIAAAGHCRATSQQARAAMLAPMLTALQGVAGGNTRT